MTNKRECLIELRGGRALSDVAPMMGITPQMLGKIERGERTPSLEVANRICNVYQTSLDKIFGK